MAENSVKHIALRGKNLKALLFYLGDHVYEIEEIDPGDFQSVFDSLIQKGSSQFNGAEGVVQMELISSPSADSEKASSVKFIFMFGGRNNVSETFSYQEVMEVVGKLSTRQLV